VGGNRKRLLGSLDGGPAVPKQDMAHRVSDQGAANAGNRLRGAPCGRKGVATFAESRRRISEQKQHGWQNHFIGAISVGGSLKATLKMLSRDVEFAHQEENNSQQGKCCRTAPLIVHASSYGKDLLSHFPGSCQLMSGDVKGAQPREHLHQVLIIS
jgi:hypothetical protein